jgi:glycosyltransferase involved in cell wall biosynthesis
VTSPASEGGGPKRPVRVLSLIPTFWPRQGGAQMVLAAIANGLGDRIEDMVLTRGYAGVPTRERYDDLDVERYLNPMPERWKDYATGTHHVPFPAKAAVALFDTLGALAPLNRLAREADLVHLHFPLPLGVSVLALPSLRRVPVIVTVHGNADIYELPPFFAPLTRAVLKRADAVVSVSEDLATHLQGALGIPKVNVVPNGIDTDLFRPTPREPSDTVTLFSISRIVPRKNIPVLINAVETLAREGEKRLRLVIAGTGPAEAEVARLASQSQGATRYLGFVDEGRKRELLAEVDVFVQLSIREGLSVATLEALASGLPCVVSDLPGVREPVTAGQTGFLVRDPERVEDVIVALKQLLDAREQLPAMRLAARKKAEERYSLTAMTEGYWTIYRDVLARRRR